ncbi:MAG: hypothetical protein E6G54_01875 [Actinobacteria bacterium]|nr:MAG: hypothetical protein E6G54_01875 [Actinomycetota bacterium]
MSASFEDVLSSSDAVWWVTVTGSQPSAWAPRGEILNVKINDALKGPVTVGAAGRAYLASCGPFMTAGEEKQTAESMVGRSFLLMGSYEKGILSPDSTVVMPQATSEDEKYARALKDLGRATPSSHRWAAWLTLGLLVGLLVSAVLVMRARTKRSNDAAQAG